MKINPRKKNHLRSPEEKKILKRERYFLILSGIVMGISFPPFPFPFTLLIFVGLIPYFFVINNREKLAEINKATYLFAFFFCLITLYWVGSWQETADPFLMISGVVLVFFNPLLFLIPSTLFYFAKKIFPVKTAFFILPFFWVAYEHLYMITDASFPWLNLGNGLPKFTTFIQIADVIGELGLTLVIVLSNVLIFKSIKKYKENNKIFSPEFLIAASLFIVILFYGIIRINYYELPDQKIKVGLIQPDIDPWKKWQGESIESLTDIYFNLSQKAADEGAELIIWPETALPVYLASGMYNETLDSIYSFIRKNNVYLLSGMPDIRYYKGSDSIPPDAKYNEAGDFYYTTYNGIYMFSPDKFAIQKYGKMKLVPFGERVPFVDALPFLGDIIKWGVGITGWNYGKDTLVFSMTVRNENMNRNDSIKISGVVCYESIYPDFISEFVDRGAAMISVVTNDSWYGKLSGPYQHKDMSILRAVENRRSVVRAANGGVSCVINPLGEIETQTNMFEKTFIVHDVLLNNELTFFTKNPLIIPVISLVFSIWIFGFYILLKMKNKYKL